MVSDNLGHRALLISGSRTSVCEEFSKVIMTLANKPTFIARQSMYDVETFSTNTMAEDVCDWDVVAGPQRVFELRLTESEAQFLQGKCREPATRSSISCSFDGFKHILGKRSVYVLYPFLEFCCFLNDGGRSHVPFCPVPFCFLQVKGT